jgi:hypothetical protein
MLQDEEQLLLRGPRLTGGNARRTLPLPLHDVGYELLIASIRLHVTSIAAMRRLPGGTENTLPRSG